MSKVYISFLGTNDYTECIYGEGLGADIAPVRFVQETTLKHFAKKAVKSDRAYIFLTTDARKKNWEDNGQWDREKKCPKQCQGLKSRIDSMNLPFHVNGVDIPEGHTEEQVWCIFEIIYNVLEHGDEVVFDITHAFRSIPMLAIIILNYSKLLKNIKLLSIHYGAFEALGPVWEVRNMPLENRIAPLLDLTPLATLSDWATAVDRFLCTGDAKAVSALARQAAAPVMAQSKGKDTAASAVKNIAEALDYFSRQLSTCRGPEIVNSVKFVKRALSENMTVDFVRPLVPLLQHVEKQVYAFNGDSTQDGIQAARWCMNHGMIQQGFTILQETIVSFIVKQCGRDEFCLNQRTIVSSLVGVLLKGTPESKWEGKLKNKEFADQVAEYREIIKQQPFIAKIWQELTDCRNDMNHAGYRKQKLSHKKFEPKLNNLIETAKNCLTKLL